MRSLELFAGIGGIALAEQMAGIEVAGLCEYADYPRAILQKHWPDVPLFKDVKKLDRKELTNAGIDPDSIDIISGGFPCQPFSIAGHRKGTEDDRDLWALRVSAAKGHPKPHVFVAFLLDKGIPYKVNHILIIPQAVADGQTGLNVTEGNAVMREYEVTEEELKKQIKELVEYAKEGWI